MRLELTQRFYFDAAHTLQREVDADASRRVHGHTYTAEVTVAGELDPASGMVVDLAHLRGAIAVVRDALDHRLLDDVPGLAKPTLECLCAYIAARLEDRRWTLDRVVVRREASGDACCLRVAPASP